MSKQLGIEESGKSAVAALSFKRNCIGETDYKMEADVIVLEKDEEDEGNYLHNITIEVQVDLGPNYHKVHVMWDQEFGSNFKGVDSELYGTYYSNYNQMEYTFKKLIIHSDNRKIIIQT